MATTDIRRGEPLEMVTNVSRREAEILAAIGRHLSNAEIATELCISIRTVETHVSSLLRKFGVADRRSLVRTAAVARRIPGLPVAHTSFVGRAHEIDTATPAVRAPGLVTLVGPGGAGKTRLACVLAERAAPAFRDPVAFVDLVPASGVFAVRAVADALGVPEMQQQPLEQSVAAFLAGRHALVVLDNCEHVVAELAPLVDRILATCPRVTVLATSRERLGLAGERVLRVGPLPLASDAETLFGDRARAADDRFSGDPAVVAAICARLDGLPLAIELAAARSASLGAQGLLAALDDVLRAVSGRAGDERHASLGAVIEWSYRLLTEAEQRLFAELSVFAGGFDLATATALSSEGSAARVADLLGRLTDKSLIVHDAGASRWRMLRTIRAFADSRLGEERRAPLQRRHLAWAAGVAAALLDDAQNPASVSWTPEFDLVVDDLRAALASADPGPDAHRLARASARLAYRRRLLRESVAHFRRAAEVAPDGMTAAADLRSAGHATFAIDRAERAYELFVASAARAGGGRGTAIALCEAVLTATRFRSGFSRPVGTEQTAGMLAEAIAAAPVGDTEVAAYLDAARLWVDGRGVDASAPYLADDSILMSAVLAAEAELCGRAEQILRAHAATAERVRLMQHMDLNEPRHAAELLEISHAAWLTALEFGGLRQALDAARRIRDHPLLGAHPYRPAAKLIPPLVLLGRFDEAVALAEPMWQAWFSSGMPTAALISPAASCVALAYGLRGDESAQRTWTLRASQVVGAPDSGLADYHDSFAGFVTIRLAIHRGGPLPPDVAELIEPGEPGLKATLSDYLTAAAAELSVISSAPDAAARVRSAEQRTRGNPWATACLTRARGRLDGDPEVLSTAVTLWDELGADFERASTLALTDPQAARPIARA